MSGHSKWSTIKRKKGAVDAKRGKIFTKLIRELSTAARLGGGDIDSNPRLRLVVDKAKIANMPKDNINRAIQKGLGTLEGAAYEEGIYEGYGPGGVAILIETLSDNKNRTASEVRHGLTKNGGSLGQSGSVSYLFEKKGFITLPRMVPGSGKGTGSGTGSGMGSGMGSGIALDLDALIEVALEAGAEDVIEGEDSVDVTSSPAAFESLRDRLEKAGFGSPDAGMTAEIIRQPSTTVALEGAQSQSMLKLLEALEDLDDVQNVYANFEISDEEMTEFA